MIRLLPGLALLLAAAPAAASYNRPNGTPIAPLAREEAEQLLVDPSTTILSTTTAHDYGMTILARTPAGLVECESSVFWTGNDWDRGRRVLTCFVLARPAPTR